MALTDLLVSAIASIYIRARFLQERIQSGVVWNLLDPSFVADPYPTYRRNIVLRGLEHLHVRVHPA